MYKVFTNNLSKKLKENELLSLAQNADGIIAGTENYSYKVLMELSNLKVISRLGVGMDNIDLGAAKNKGIKIFKTQTSPAPAVAELTLGLMLSVARKISQTSQYLREGKWKKQMGCLLEGKTLGIIGLGVIGKSLVQLSSGFGFKILAFDKNKDEKFAEENNITYCDLETLIKNSDIISIHLNLSEETKYIINKEKIKLMKTSAILINTSRGELIDENAVYDAINSNNLAGAGIDVFEQEPYLGPLIELDNVVLTPHIGAYAKEIRVKMEIEAVENLIIGLNEK